MSVTGSNESLNPFVNINSYIRLDLWFASIHEEWQILDHAINGQYFTTKLTLLTKYQFSTPILLLKTYSVIWNLKFYTNFWYLTKHVSIKLWSQIANVDSNLWHLLKFQFLGKNSNINTKIIFLGIFKFWPPKCNFFTQILLRVPYFCQIINFLSPIQF